MNETYKIKGLRYLEIVKYVVNIAIMYTMRKR